MPNLNSVTNISAYINTVFEGAMLVARDNTLMPGLVTVYSDRTGSALRQSSQYGTAVLNAISDTDDLASQAFTPAVLSTLTPAEAGAQFFLPDLRVESDPFTLQQDASMELGNATAQKIERDLLGAFTSFTGGTVGAAGTAITWGYFYAMLSLLRGQNAPMPYRFVCHPYQWHTLGKALAPGSTYVNGQMASDRVMQNYYITSMAGVDILVTSNLSVDSSDDAVAGMFSPMAVALDVRRAPRLERERDASRRGWELNMTTVYASGVWRPKFGVKGTFDASAPTS